MNLSEEMRRYINLLNEDDRSNIKKLPNSNFHKMLKIIERGNGADEADVTRELNLAQGFILAEIFQILKTYNLAEPKDLRSIGPLTDRGKKALEILNTGQAVNLKTLEPDEKSLEREREKTDWQKAKIDPLSHAAHILYQLSNNPEQKFKSTEIYNNLKGKFSKEDHNRYLKKLRSLGLITLEKSGSNYVAQITPEGVDMANELDAVSEAFQFRRDINQNLRDIKENKILMKSVLSGEKTINYYDISLLFLILGNAAKILSLLNSATPEKTSLIKNFDKEKKKLENNMKKNIKSVMDAFNKSPDWVESSKENKFSAVDEAISFLNQINKNPDVMDLFDKDFIEDVKEYATMARLSQ